jgi:hypothetical protein
VAFAAGGNPDAVASVVALVEGASPQLVWLDRVGGWTALVADVDPGTHPVTVKALGADGGVLFLGGGAVSVRERGASALLLTLRPAQAGDGAPIVLALSADATFVGFGGSVGLQASVTDPDPADASRLTLSWTASAGTFSGGTGGSTARWVAPLGPAPQSVELEVTVTDPGGLSATRALWIGVGLPLTGSDVVAEANSWPRLLGAWADATVYGAGAVVQLHAAATDADGDPLAFAWDTGTCPGVFVTAPGRRDAAFQLGDLGAAASCTLAVTVRDGRGGAATGSVTLAKGPPDTLPLPIVDLVIAPQAAFTGDPVNVAVLAHDPSAASTLAFAWTGHNGVLGPGQSGHGLGTISFTSTPCSGDAWVDVTIRNAVTSAEVQLRIDVPNCPASCKDLQRVLPAAGDGPYGLDPDGAGSGTRPPLTAWCDMTTDGGGWTFLGHWSRTSAQLRLFDQPVGTYDPARGSGPAYGLGVLPSLDDAEMMIAIDDPSPARAAAANRLLVVRHAAADPNFGWGPWPCYAYPPFEYRLATSGDYGAEGHMQCTPTTWGLQDASSQRWLVQLGGPGVFLGAGLGGAEGWGHEAFIYVR